MPKNALNNTAQAMDLADNWLGVPKVPRYCLLLLLNYQKLLSKIIKLKSDFLF